MATARQTIVGVFDEPGMADNAIDALQQAGFNADQIYYSAHASTGGGGFMEGLKRLFSDNTDAAPAGHVSHDLTNFGLSGDEADYYDREYQAGHGVVAVRTGGRDQEALNILQTNGAHSYTSGAAAAGGTGYDTDTTTATSGAATYSDRGTVADATATGYNTNVDATNVGATTGYDTDATATGTTAGYNTDATAAGATTNYATDATTNAGTYNTGTDVDTDEQRRLRLREERLNIDKQAVQTGQVGLHKEVISEQKNIDVPVTHEEVYVERRAVTDQVDDATPIGEGETINIPVSAEQVNVSKDTVTTGEVGIGKRVVEGTQRVSDTVRREEARIDQTGNVPIQDTTSTTNTGYTTDGTDTTVDDPNR